jgi:hypothetical protein
MRAILVILFVVVTPRAARADDWYGWQTLSSDLAAHTTFGIGLSRGNRFVTIAGVALWVLGPAAIHLTNDEPERAGASLVARIGLPAVGAAVGSVLAGDDESCDGTGCFGRSLGVLGGIVAATIFDAVIAFADDDDDAMMLTIGGAF